jgi:osmotically-inducible protein OsmY
MILFRILFFPVKLVANLLGFTLKVGYKTGSIPFKVTARTSRLVGFKGFVLLAVGIAIGLLAAPATGRELRIKLRRLLEGSQPLSDNDLAEKVGFELSHAPRTWHLPQPEVAVVSGRVELLGTVPHETGREELERVAASVPGVSAVDNRLQVDESAPSNGDVGPSNGSS